jgi:hypothetical protein
MGYAPSTTAEELAGIGVPRAKRTPRVYEPEEEEEEYPIGGREEEVVAETETKAEES